MKKLKLLQQVYNEGIVAVIRGDSAEEALAMARQTIIGGINLIEITMTVPGALQVIELLSLEAASTEPPNNVVIGAGTVLDAETARAAISAGSAFIVSPSLSESTIELCHRYRIPVMPGCMTIQEIQRAMELGVDVIKLFPGNLYQPSVISAIKGPLPQVNIMPTGGVDLDNISDWLKAGAYAIGIGSDLTKEAVRQKNYHLIRERAAQYVAAVRLTRAQQLQ
ncbi:bifunctional 2-keto-4-hydroxyglutarate aldolase/2-keto-3-deoxy-6-phosphogluconate aldolase [Paenibacillus soyae]|uniref:Bifunctional 2-keto-4-hydroxyglutarate aldolase/2-keto-3-deoxy-6-phosphogluconate aldolase n=1 Tax=Paenibacillus soyae TaxID=2969249 RepID=A0A9X2MMA6_9BACL|nr:bifunctional 2-keto-4-hydroxyglutarate aldolase/2-keto-3-deoxy-6-phosphogluconate aldolase [Paenibacillus soyae]MCR2802682.1 bifunctional 2-keto-4-hydroxyglutarate aldolase/2-keto-3-deoxy-6-phosphogluconate aldolase [Paenibacillus soyae]